MSGTNSFIDRSANTTQQQPGVVIPSSQPDNSSLDGLDITPIDELEISNRNENNVVSLSDKEKVYTKYKIDKQLPTLDQDDLDDILDDEWDFYIDPEKRSRPRQDGLFLINNEISLNPPDFHNEYIKRGPANIDARILAGENPDVVVKTTFCVFFIQNNTALPIPNYKTLEVMLVERDKTYDNIQESTPEQVAEFDLEIDGRFTADNDGDIDPVEEFRFRQMLDRSASWNQRVRFASGYRPGNDENAVQFFRDPGDYLLPPNQRENGFYNLQVFQKQTYREKLRERFEGKMIALQWPIVYPEGLLTSDTGSITLQELNQPISDDDVISNDKVFFVRMMINGYWKQVISLPVFRLYALVNELDLSQINLDSGAYGPLGDKLFSEYIVALSGASAIQNTPKGGIYGVNGIINVLKNAGGIDVLQDYNITNTDLNAARTQIIGLYALLNNFLGGGSGPDANGNLLDSQGNISFSKEQLDTISDNFTNEVKAPGWSDFPHIIEVDRLDPGEYQEYLDNFNNGGDPFGIEYLQPYEPPGSVKYYPTRQINALQQQANAQAAVEQVKKQIQEILPDLTSRAAELSQRFDAQPANYLNYVNSNLGPSSDIYKVLFSDDKFKYGKKKNNGTIKQKGTDFGFMKLLEKQDGIFRKMNKSEETSIFYVSGKRDYTRLVEQGDHITDKLANYTTDGNKKLITPDWGTSISDQTIGQAIGSVAAVGGGATAATAVGGAASFAIAAGSTAALGAGAVIAAPVILGAGIVAGAAVAVTATLDVNIEQSGLPKRRGMPRNFVGIRQKRLMKRNNYIKLIIGTYIYKEVVREQVTGLTLADGSSCDIFDKASEIDSSFSQYKTDIDNALVLLKDIDARLITSTSPSQFEQIFIDLQTIESDFDTIDLDIFEQGEDLKTQIDDAVKYMIKQQYDAIQRARKLINDDRNGKYFIAFPQDVKDTISAYFPGKTFDNYQPEEFAGF